VPQFQKPKKKKERKLKKKALTAEELEALEAEAAARGEAPGVPKMPAPAPPLSLAGGLLPVPLITPG
jgi:hypothetical protein